jgi:DNA polymerase-4
MSESNLERLIGDYARELKWRAHGNGGTALHAERLQRSISRETTLSRDSRSAEELDRLLVRFIGFIAAELREDGLVAKTVTLKLRHADFKTLTRRRTLETATDLDAELLAPARELFQVAFREAQRLNKAIRLIGVAATNLSQATPADLFEAPQRTRLRELTQAIDRARAKFGHDAVGPARLVPRPGKPDKE